MNKSVVAAISVIGIVVLLVVMIANDNKHALSQQVTSVVTVGSQPGVWYAANSERTDCIQSELTPGKFIAYYQGEGETVHVDDRGVEVVVTKYGDGITEIHFFHTYSGCVAARITAPRELADRYR